MINTIRPFPDVPGIHPIVMPLPGLDLITLNLYAVGSGPVTLIDTGMKIPGALDVIRDNFRLHGLDLDDIERIVITHGHMDHFGMAVTLREAAGRDIPCFIHEDDRWRIASGNFVGGMWTAEMEYFMAMAGAPEAEIRKVRDRFSFFRGLCDPLDDVTVMHDGDVFEGDGYHLTVIHTPGHTTGMSCLYEAHRKILFSGDHVIKHITPNPLMEVKRGHLSDPDYQSLRTYIKSLDRLSMFDVRLVFPGHGEYMDNIHEIISRYLVHHRDRMEIIRHALEKESRPLFQLIDAVFPHVPEGDTFLAISELLVHLEMLVGEGRAELADPGPPALYRAL